MDDNAIQAATRTRAQTINAGAACAREHGRRTENPYAADTEAWASWSDGFDQQAAWLEAGRGEYQADGARRHTRHR